MPKTLSYEGYQMEVGKEPADILPMLRRSGTIAPATFEVYYVPPTLEEEEQGISRQDIMNASSHFERNRGQVRQALRAIVGWVFDEFNLPSKNVVDFGSGATGEMMHQLLKGKVDPITCAEVELNLKAVEENKRRHPQAVIYQGSYHNVQALGLHSNLDMVTGLSSLDATQFVAHAVEQMSSTLKPDGWFFHVQDVRPGAGAGYREMQSMGIKQQPYDVEAFRSTDLVLTYKTPEGFLSVGELFRRNLERAVQADPTLDLVLSDWVVAKRRLSLQELGRVYYLNSLLTVAAPVEEASMVVTLARKKAA